MSNLVTLTIDGVEVSVPKGTLIVEAAKQTENEIPVFCYHSKLEPVGMCRMCLVSVGTPVINRATGEAELDEAGNPVVRFFPKPLTACTTPVSPGMQVITQSEESLADRRAVLEFLLTSHPLDCPVCDKGGECPLQDLAYAHGPGKSRFPFEAKHHGPKKEPLGDLIVLDTERCIICTRCVRFQDEIAGDPVLAVENRGRDARIVSYSKPTFDSKYSGNTTDICPVGALTTRDFRFGARAWELSNVPGVCNHCGVGCNTVTATRIGEIKRIMPRQNEAVNEIWLCDKGRFGHHFNSSRNRLTAPLIKKEGQFVEASWDEALALVAQKLGAAGSNAGGIAGPRLSNEDLYLFQKLFREALGSANIDHRLGLNAVIDDTLAYEVGAGAGIGRLKSDSAILVIGADLDEEAPITYLRVRSAARRGTHLINAGGRWTKLDAVAQTSLRYRYGAEAHLVWAMAAAIVEEDLVEIIGRIAGNIWEVVTSTVANALDRPHKKVEAHAEDGRLRGMSDLRMALLDYAPEKVADIVGISAEDIRAAAKTFAEAEDGLILYGLESNADPSLQAAIKTLVLVTGHVGRANNGVIPILPHANSRGAADLGVLPHRLPGYLPVEGDPGLSAAEMLDAESGLSALYIAAADPAAQSEAYAAALEATDFVVVQDLFLTETAKLADVVLPAKGIAERDGTFTNFERRVQAFDVAVPAPVNAWADWLITTAIAGRLGADWTYASADGVMAEITQTVPLYAEMSFANITAPVSLERKMSHYIYSGMSFTAAAREGLQWATAAEDDSPVFKLEFIAPAGPPADAEMLLVAPRVLYDGGTLISQADVVAAHIQQPQITLSVEDAARLGLSNGDEVSVSANGVSLRLPAQINRLTPQGIALLPRNLSGSSAERLLNGNGVFTPVEIKNGN